MLKRKLLLSLSLVSIQGCAILGVGGAYQTIDTITTGATAISYGTTGKGLTDHAVSTVVGKDCRMFNVLKNKHVCRVHKTYEVNFYNGLKNTYLITKEPVNVTKLGKRHERHARKVRCARSRVKNGCK
jgi:hypothetical protein